MVILARLQGYNRCLLLVFWHQEVSLTELTPSLFLIIHQHPPPHHHHHHHLHSADNRYYVDCNLLNNLNRFSQGIRVHFSLVSLSG